MLPITALTSNHLEMTIKRDQVLKIGSPVRNLKLHVKFVTVRCRLHPVIDCVMDGLVMETDT